MMIARMATVRVVQQSSTLFLVNVDDGRGESQHEVTVMPSDVERYGPHLAPEELVEATFHFLLEREPKEAILRRFDLPVVESYFPEFRHVLGGE